MSTRSQSLVLVLLPAAVFCTGWLVVAGWNRDVVRSDSVTAKSPSIRDARVTGSRTAVPPGVSAISARLESADEPTPRAAPSASKWPKLIYPNPNPLPDDEAKRRARCRTAARDRVARLDEPEDLEFKRSLRRALRRSSDPEIHTAMGMLRRARKSTTTLDRIVSPASVGEFARARAQLGGQSRRARQDAQAVLDALQRRTRTGR